MKILDSNSKNFEKKLDILLTQRQNKIKINLTSVTTIINDVKRNGDKAVLKYEKKFNKNKIIKPTSKQISKSIINRIYHLDRGYENIEHKLKKIGVKIKRLKQ